MSDWFRDYFDRHSNDDGVVEYPVEFWHGVENTASVDMPIPQDAAQLFRDQRKSTDRSLGGGRWIVNDIEIGGSCAASVITACAYTGGDTPEIHLLPESAQSVGIEKLDGGRITLEGDY